MFKEENWHHGNGMIIMRGDDLKSEYKEKPPAWRKNLSVLGNFKGKGWSGPQGALL